ncbi:hypothetical protein BJ322DRAFT_1024176 [Thelephora terrestris]|uniref:Uncharacterized protein n=1 Tax=Thelephora terrestris TaxID=56493 RepID=A0A9P6H582_9AGAM|nr:hypothetical protein BJ322DRAFT_1024176 [Thelephora terrestris]
MSLTTTVYPSSSTMATDSRAVRFETECVLIPEPPAESLIRKLGKSFTLPLLKKSPEVEADPRARIIEERFGGRGVGHRHRRSSPSPARDDSPLVPCIVKHDGPSSPTPSSPTSGFNRPSMPRRRSSLPTSSRADVVTIPLRSCCPDCETIWEESQKEGEQWKEKFTRGARRLRSLSSDTRLAVHQRHGSLDSAHSHSFGYTPSVTIKVDEVDKRKGSSVVVDPNNPIDLPPDTERRHASDSSVPTSLSTTGCVKTRVPEEDEDQLFPLPKRSPSSSPIPSPTGSSSSLHATNLKNSPSSSRESITQRTRIPTPNKSNRLTSPPPPSPISKSFSAPLPPKNVSFSVGRGASHDKAYLQSESILGPSITRETRPSPKKSKLWSTGVSFTKAAGTGLLKGVSSINVSPGTHHP